MYWLSGGFVFRRVISPFHKLDPRVKLLVSMEFFIVSLIASTVPEIAAVLLAILVIAAVVLSLAGLAVALQLLGGRASAPFVYSRF